MYVPPRIAAAHYEDSATVKKRRQEERQARKLRDTELYRYVDCLESVPLLFGNCLFLIFQMLCSELQEEFADEPTEVRDYSRLFGEEVYNRAEQERQLRFEEDNYRRLAETKAQKKARKSRKFRYDMWVLNLTWWVLNIVIFFRNELDDLTKFGNFARVAGRQRNAPSEDLGI